VLIWQCLRLQERVQYLHQFVMHAALDAVDEQLWSTSAMHLGVVDRFNNLQARLKFQHCSLALPGKHICSRSSKVTPIYGALIAGFGLCDSSAHQVSAAARWPQ
jgi:Sedlin, N-terminal conserved region